MFLLRRQLSSACSFPHQQRSVARHGGRSGARPNFDFRFCSDEMAAPLASLLPVPGSKRADLLGLKLKLATALAPEQGKTYWTALVAFCTGRLNRDELGLVLSAVLGPDTVPLHNALLLAILYNTTRPTLPSSQRHPGWHTRKRDPSGRKVEDSDPKRRRLKAAVMALGKRERADIKALSPERPEPIQLAHGFDSKGAGRRSPDPSDDGTFSHLGS